jgi:hypothetical protein
MAGDETIGEAVRQLGRAVGTLARVLVRVARRVRLTTARPEPASGPPQAWLDLVAETDPEWLARSRWADRTARPGRERRRRRGAGKDSTGTRARAAERAADRDTGATDAPSPRVSPGEGVAEQVAPVEPPMTRVDVAAVDGPSSDGGTAQEMSSRTLVPAEPMQVRPVPPEASQAARLVRVEDVRLDPDHETPPDPPVRGTSRLLGAPEPSHRPSEAEPSPIESTPGPVRHSSYSPLSAHVRGLPGTWPSRPTPEPLRPASPPPPPAPTWPELPRTDGLEDAGALPGRGLAAILWDLDGRPDPLTTAQRRS